MPQRLRSAEMLGVLSEHFDKLQLLLQLFHSFNKLRMAEALQVHVFASAVALHEATAAGSDTLLSIRFQPRSTAGGCPPSHCRVRRAALLVTATLSKTSHPVPTPMFFLVCSKQRQLKKEERKLKGRKQRGSIGVGVELAHASIDVEVGRDGDGNHSIHFLR